MSAGPIDQSASFFKSLVFDPLVGTVSASIIGLAPFLAFPPIAFIIRKVVSLVADKLFAGLQMSVNFQVILLKNVKAHAEFADASIELKQIARTKGIESPEFKRARDARKIKLAALIRHPA